MIGRTLLLLFILLAAATSLSYFKYQRRLETTKSSGQHYAIADETLWGHAQAGFNDLRMYSAEKEIPYTLTIERGGEQTVQKVLRLLQPGTVGGKTQFLLDMAGVPEYDRVELKLAARNFVAHARVEGQDDSHGADWAILGTTTLYDLSDERLGRNNTLQIPLTTYRYLRVTIDSPMKPSDIVSGSAGMTRAQKAVWRDLDSQPTLSQQGQNTVLAFVVPANVPLERIIFAFDPTQPNFQRVAEIQDASGQPLGSGELTRIHMQRNGQKIDVEQASLDVRGTSQGTLKAIIHNGDDVPLKIAGARLQQYERRVYFDSDAGTQPVLFYGDDKLGVPVYDYAKLFEKDANASRVQIEAEEANAAYTGRPDARPWSERHPALLWMAIIAAVLVLGGIAMRSMKGATRQSPH